MVFVCDETTIEFWILIHIYLFVFFRDDYTEKQVEKHSRYSLALITSLFFTIVIEFTYLYGTYAWSASYVYLYVYMFILLIATLAKFHTYPFVQKQTKVDFLLVYKSFCILYFWEIKKNLYNFYLFCLGKFEYKPRPVKNLKYYSDLLYDLQKKMFIYVKPSKLEDIFLSMTDEEYIKFNNRLKKLYDPNILFNRLSRLPWKIKFNYNANDYYFYKLSVKHLIILYNFFKSSIIAISLCTLYFIYTVFFFKIQFLKQISVWFVVGMLFFWLISGFNFFLKRYQFGKFTSQIQRFWKRTNTYFWLIEGFLLLLFFYYFLNSSQEPLYMYDYSSLNQEYLISLYTAFVNIVILSLVIYFLYFIMLRLNSNSWEQLNLYLLIASSFIFFSFFIETYQFYYVISIFNEKLWFFNEDDNLWSIDQENPILRTKTQYFLVCLIAKYWHFLFIFLSWVFFLMKSFEKKKVTIVFFGANMQNIIILYFLNLACYAQWFKWVYRRFFDLPYTWFFISIDNKFFYKFIQEMQLILNSLFNFNSDLYTISIFIYKSLAFWNVDSLAMWKFI